jgi:hypothetical protein
MLRSEVLSALAKRPFLPLVIRLDDGTIVDVPFAHVAIPFGKYLLVMQGVKSETSHTATGKVDIAYERIDRIEPRRSRGGQRRKKAS